MKALNDSLAYCDGAYADTNDANFNQLVKRQGRGSGKPLAAWCWCSTRRTTTSTTGTVVYMRLRDTCRRRPPEHNSRSSTRVVGGDQAVPRTPDSFLSVAQPRGILERRFLAATASVRSYRVESSPSDRRSWHPNRSYEVAALIGEGGMGKVYRATDTNLKRTVALKVLPEAVATDTERLARFQREAEVLARLNHPNIAQIHGLEKSDGTTALVMELVEGPTLADRIAQGAIPLDEALPIAKQIADALEAPTSTGLSTGIEARQHQSAFGWHRQGTRLRLGEGADR